MQSLERHRDVGAYALGVLDEAEAFRFEDHLMECPSCAVQVTEFGPATRQLMLYRNATPRTVHPMAQPSPRMLDRLLSPRCPPGGASDGAGCCWRWPRPWCWRCPPRR